MTLGQETTDNNCRSTVYMCIISYNIVNKVVALASFAHTTHEHNPCTLNVKHLAAVVGFAEKQIEWKYISG